MSSLKSLSLSLIILFTHYLGYNQQDTIAEKALQLPINELPRFYNQLSESFRSENAKKCFLYAEKARFIADSINDDVQLAEALNNIGWYYYLFDVPDSSLNYIKKAQSIFKNRNDQKGIAKTYKSLGNAFLFMNEMDSVINKYNKAKELYVEMNDQKELSHIYNNIGIYHQYTGNYNKAISYLSKSLEISESLNDNKQVLKALYNIAHLLNKQGNYKKSIQFAFRALDIASKINNTYSKSTAYQLLGNNYDYLEQSELALKYHLKDFRLSKQMEDETSISISYNNIGNVYLGEKKFDSALHYFFLSLEIKKRLNSSRRMAISLNNIGETYFQMEDLANAQLYLNKAIKINKEYGFNAQLNNSYLNLGRIFVKQKKYKQAEKYFTECLKNDLENSIEDNALVYEQLSLVYEKTGDYPKSLRFYKKFASNKDSIYSKEKIQLIENLRFEFQLEEKNRKIELLKKETEVQDLKLTRQSLVSKFFIISSIIFLIIATVVIWLYKLNKKKSKILGLVNAKIHEKNERISITSNKLELANEELEKTVAAKNRMFSIIAHDLRSPFQSLIGLSSLLYAKYSTMADDRRVAFIKDIKRSAEINFELVENLLTWARSQTGRLVIKPREINIYELIEDTIELYEQIAKDKGVAINNLTNSEVQFFIDEPSLNTMLRNLVSNAVKYTKEGDSIDINATIENNVLKLTVADSGSGIPEEKAAHLFSHEPVLSTNGTSNEKGTGLGLLLCKELIDKNNGDISVESTIGKGSTFTLIIPHPQK